jgi:hypothetical protein
VGKTGMGLIAGPTQQYKDKGQSADRGKQPTMLGMSAHSVSDVSPRPDNQSKLKLQSDSFRG